MILTTWSDRLEGRTDEEAERVALESRIVALETQVCDFTECLTALFEDVSIDLGHPDR
jgi:hypothetical protein